MRQNSVKIAGFSIFSVFSLLLLAACGGGDGSDVSEDIHQLVYIGNTNKAVITRQNATTLVANVLYGGESSTNIPTSVSLSEPESRSAGSIIQSEIIHHMSSLIRENIYGNAGSAGNILSGFDVNLPLECESGSGSVSGILSDNTGTGTLTFSFNNCLNEGITYNGSGSFIVDYFDFGYLIPTDVRIVFPLMSISSEEFTGQASGSLRLQSLIAENTDRMTLNYTARDSLTGKMYKYENIIITTVYDNYFTPTNMSVAFSGSSARAYDSIHGYVEINTTLSLAFSSIMLTYPDIDGIMTFYGAEGASIRVTVLTGEQLQIELDIDGMPGYEESRILLWEELAVNLETDLTNIDLVNILRVPLAGFSLTGLTNDSYVGQTFRLPEAVTAERLTVFIASASVGIDFYVLLVEMSAGPEIHPTNVLYESNRISLASVYAPVPVTVDLGGISLNADQQYAWLIDGYAAYDGISKSAHVSVNLPDPYPEGEYIHSGSFSSHTTTREENFADFWYSSDSDDMSFILEYR